MERFYKQFSRGFTWYRNYKSCNISLSRNGEFLYRTTQVCDFQKIRDQQNVPCLIWLRTQVHIITFITYDLSNVQHTGLNTPKIFVISVQVILNLFILLQYTNSPSIKHEWMAHLLGTIFSCTRSWLTQIAVPMFMVMRECVTQCSGGSDWRFVMIFLNNSIGLQHRGITQCRFFFWRLVAGSFLDFVF